MYFNKPVFNHLNNIKQVSCKYMQIIAIYKIYILSILKKKSPGEAVTLDKIKAFTS